MSKFRIKFGNFSEEIFERFLVKFDSGQKKNVMIIYVMVMKTTTTKKNSYQKNYNVTKL